jgi:hypothetical protein
MNAVDLLANHGIKLESIAPGVHYTICPECSVKRKQANQKRKVLRVKIDERGACWKCCHCGWTGPEKGSGGNGRRRPVKSYEYPDKDGTLIFQKVRAYDKSGKKFFWIRRPDGKGGWIKGAGNANTKLLYRLPEVIEAVALGHEIAVVEGEADADRLWDIGIPATCSPHGAQDVIQNPKSKPKWYPELSEQLRGAKIVVFNDNDRPGYAHADATCRMSLGIAACVRRLDLAPYWPNMSKGADVSDWLDAGHGREELDALMAAASDYQPGQTEKQHRDRPRLITAQELNAMRFDPIKYVVPGYIVEGLTLFAGKPKIGKSWLLLHAAIAVARGGFTLGDIHCIEGDVLYCALEDNPRRLQSRMTKLLGVSQPWPKRLTFQCEMPRLADGGLAEIKAWIEAADHPRLIIIDTLAMVRAPKKRDETNYEADYNAAVELRTLANTHGVAIILVHHLRKQDADDAFDTISGTLGLTGCPDTVMLIKREPTGIVLHARGRDLIEVEKAITFNRDACAWTILGEVSAVRASNERKNILAAMAEIELPASPTAIARAARLKPDSVRHLLLKMAIDGLVQKANYGKYALASVN